MSDPSATGVETSLNAGCPITTGYSYGGLFSNLLTEFFVFSLGVNGPESGRPGKKVYNSNLSWV